MIEEMLQPDFETGGLYGRIDGRGFEETVHNTMSIYDHMGNIAGERNRPGDFIAWVPKNEVKWLRRFIEDSILGWISNYRDHFIVGSFVIFVWVLMDKVVAFGRLTCSVGAKTAFYAVLCPANAAAAKLIHASEDRQNLMTKTTGDMRGPVNIYMPAQDSALYPKLPKL